MKLLLIKKDLKLFFINKKAVILTFLIPILLITLFAFAFGGVNKKESKLKPIELFFKNNDNSLLSKKIIEELDSIEEINLVLSSKIEGEDLVKKGEKVGFLIIDKGFQDSLVLGKELPIKLIYDASKKFEYSIVKSIVTGILLSNKGKEFQKNKIKNYLNQNYGNLTEIQKNKIEQNINDSQSNDKINSIPFKEISIIKAHNNDQILGLIQAVSGTAIMMLLFSITGVGGGLLEEKESGTLKRLLFSPIKKTDILFGKMGATFIISFIQLSIMFIFAWIAFDLPIFKDIISLVLLTLSVSFAVTSFGIFLVAVAKSRQQLQSLSTIIILIMSAIGGSMIPIFIMPAFMQKMAIFSLNYWGIQGYYDIFWRELSLVEILSKMAILCSIGIFMLFISIPLFKRNIIEFTN